MAKKINEKIGAYLLNGGTRGDLAASLGISRPCLNGRISGASKWYWHEVVTIAKITGCTLDELTDL